MYTSAALIARACAIAKAPGFTSQAGQYLNMILSDLCDIYDFDFIRVTTTINLLPGILSYPLPADHLRTREVFYNISGAPFYLDQIPIEDYDQLFSGAGISNYPEKYMVKVEDAPNSMYFWPPSSISTPVTVRYQPLMADIVNPESSNEIPWFINQRYLLTKLAADLMSETDDERQNNFEARAEKMLTLFLQMKDDSEGYAKQIKLDGRTFRNRSGLKGTKQTGIW